MSTHLPQPSLRKGAAWVVGSRIAGILATVAGNILAARLLGPEQFGIFLLMSAIIACGATLAMAGLNEAGLRFIAQSLSLGQSGLARAYLRRIARLATTTTALAAVLTAGGIAAFALLTGRLADPWLLAALAVGGLIALATQQIVAELLRGWQDLRLASLFSGGQAGGPVSNFLFVAGLLAAFWFLPAVSATVALSLLLVSVAVTAPLAIVGLVWKVRRTPLAAGASQLTQEQSRELVSVAGTLLGIQFLAFITLQFDIWIGGALLSDEELGLYGAAKRCLLLAAMPVQMSMLAVVGRIPALHAMNRRDELERLLRGSALLAAAPSLVALVGLVCFPQLALAWVFGSSYAGAGELIWVLAVGNLALVLCGNPVHTLAMTGKHRIALAVNLFSASILAVGGWLATRAFGAGGLAAASAGSLVVQNVLLWWLARRHVGVWTHPGWVSPVSSKSWIARLRSAVTHDHDDTCDATFPQPLAAVTSELEPGKGAN